MGSGAERRAPSGHIERVERFDAGPPREGPNGRHGDDGEPDENVNARRGDVKHREPEDPGDRQQDSENDEHRGLLSLSKPRSRTTFVNHGGARRKTSPGLSPSARTVASSGAPVAAS